jgi:hypothetical protein
MFLAKVVFCSIIIFACIYCFNLYRLKKISLYRFVLWFFTYVVLFFMIMFIEITTKVANLIGIGRGVDLVNYLGYILIFYLIMKIFVKLDNLKIDISKIVRHIAINDEKNN